MAGRNCRNPSLSRVQNPFLVSGAGDRHLRRPRTGGKPVIHGTAGSQGHGNRDVWPLCLFGKGDRISRPSTREHGHLAVCKPASGYGDRPVPVRRGTSGGLNRRLPDDQVPHRAVSNHRWLWNASSRAGTRANIRLGRKPDMHNVQSAPKLILSRRTLPDFHDSRAMRVMSVGKQNSYRGRLH